MLPESTRATVTAGLQRSTAHTDTEKHPFIDQPGLPTLREAEHRCLKKSGQRGSSRGGIKGLSKLGWGRVDTQGRVGSVMKIKSEVVRSAVTVEGSPRVWEAQPHTPV